MLDQAAAIWEAASTGKLVTIDRKDIEVAWSQSRNALQRQR